MKILSIIGTRPEAIKMAPVVKALERRAGVHSRVVLTGQHRDMTGDVLALFGIRPEYDLDLMTADQTPSQVASAVIGQLERVLAGERPDWMLVQGDTTTTMAAAVAGSYAKTRVAHVEAGLRTGNKREPFPEELNRRVVSAVADLSFAPTQGACDNLIAEGIPRSSIVITGNPVIDALRDVAGRADAGGPAGTPIPCGAGARIVLVTAHRRENFGRGLAEICEAIARLASRYGEQVRFVYPVHPNAHVTGPVHRALAGVPQVTLVPPLSYAPFVRLMARAHLVLTDSGGIQEEAPSLGKPVLVLRDVTERPEAVAAGTVRLVGARADAIVDAFAELWEDEAAYERMARAHNPYGDGHAADRIVCGLLGEPVDEFTPRVD